MLTFFRKHQRIVFGLVATVTAFSFCFYGTYAAIAGINQQKELEETRLTHDMKGGDVSVEQIRRLVAFLSGFESAGQEVRINPFGNDFFETQILQTGLAAELATRYWTLVAPELSEIRASFESKRLYSHPKLPFLNTRAIWERYAPELAAKYEHLQSFAEDEISLDYFQALVDLYLAEKAFPPEMLRQAIHMEAMRFGQSAQDPGLYESRLALMGSCDPALFFGGHFMQIAAQYVHHTACYARAQGLTIQNKEALSLAHGRLTQFVRAQVDPKATIDADLFGRALSVVHMTQKQLCSTLMDIELFEQLMRNIAAPLLISPVALEGVHAYGTTTVSGQIHRMQDSLIPTSMWQLGRIQNYMDLVMKAPEHPLAIPKTLKPVAEVAEKHPAFVCKRLVLDVAMLTPSHAASQVATSELMNWIVSEEGWSMMQAQFPLQRFSRYQERDARIAAFDQVSIRDRMQADRIALGQIVKANPELMQKMLLEVASEQKEVTCFLDGTVTGLEHIHDGHALLTLLAEGKMDELGCYTEDHMHFYKLAPISVSEVEIASFNEIRSEALDLALTEKLTPLYEQIREKLPGEADFNHCKEHLVFMAWQPLMHAIEEYEGTKAPFIALDEASPDFSFYLQRRFAYAVASRAPAESENSSLILFNVTATPFEYKGRDQAPASLEKLFDMAEGSETALHYSQQWGAYTAELLSTEPSDRVSEATLKIRDHLAAPACKAMHQELLAIATEKQLLIVNDAATC